MMQDLLHAVITIHKKVAEKDIQHTAPLQLIKKSTINVSKIH